jgi:hypothetical protein
VKTELPPTVLAGRYVLEEPIGRNDAGVAWRALDTVLDRTVAVRLMLPDPSDPADFAERLFEAARVASCVHHPGLVPLLDVGTEDGVAYLVREHVEGESLRERLARDGMPDPREAASIAAQVRDALSAARAAGLEHLDLKPENVMIEAGGRVRVTDLGLAALVGAGAQETADSHDGFLAELEEIAHREPEVVPQPRERTSWFRSWLLVPVVVVLLGAALIAVGLSLGELQVGGPLGVRLHRHEEPPSPPAIVTLQVTGVSSFDPFGDNVENDGGLAFVIDGALPTVWKSENYFDGTMHKRGVGVLLDLGRPRTVTGFELRTPAPGFRFEVLVGNDPRSLVARGGPEFVAAQDIRGSLTPTSGRYVLVWITTVVPVPDGHRAEIADLKVTGET